jgi:putative DNA methylase
MRDEAEKRIGHLYPKAKLPKEYGGGEATVIAWLWARTVKCPNPACGAQMPLVRSFALSTKAGKQAWVEPVVDRSQQPPVMRFEVRTGTGKPREGTVNRRGTSCLCCNTPVPFDHVRAEGRAGRMGTQLMAIVAEGARGRVYLAPTPEHEAIAARAAQFVPTDVPDTDLPEQALGFRVQLYGMTKHRDLFTPRQLVALTTFSDLVGEARARVLRDAVAAGLPDDGMPLEQGGTGATAYADAVATYLAFAVDRGAESWCSLARWQSTGDKVAGAYARQALPMLWDYAEVNPFSSSTRNFGDAIAWVAEVLEFLSPANAGFATQHNASASTASSALCKLIGTDPPYYDNIGYADLSDFFYVWMRRTLAYVYPSLFGTLLVPKTQELVATPYRFGGDKEQARTFFEAGLGKTFANLRETTLREYPVTVYYAFKQTESDDGDEGEDDLVSVASTGWETMLEGLIRAGFSITGTWPMRTERSARSVSLGTNALASSIVLVCRPRPDDAPLTTRRDFLAALKRELPPALRDLQRGNIAPVDLAQASIGPGMAIYSRYSRVLEADGSAMAVRTALALINQAMDAYLAEQEGEYDADTRWALAWFEQYGFEEGAYGVAETLSKAKNTSVSGMVEAGILAARGGKARLLRREELPTDWTPAGDARLTVWEVAQQLIRRMQEQGEDSAAALLAQVGGLGETARDLAYRLYVICERKGWAQEALPYNALVVAWSDVGRMAGEVRESAPVQGRLF